MSWGIPQLPAVLILVLLGELSSSLLLPPPRSSCFLQLLTAPLEVSRDYQVTEGIPATTAPHTAPDTHAPTVTMYTAVCGVAIKVL